MKTISISEAQFEALFKSTLNELELETIKAQRNEKLNGWEIQALSDLHQKFIYKICILKDMIEKT